MATTTVTQSDLSRRSLLALAAALPFVKPLAAAAAGDAATPPAVEFANPYPFDFQRLKARAKVLASRPYDPPRVRVPEILDRLGYLAHRDIAHKPELSVWSDGGGPFPVRLYHLGRHYQLPVNVHVVEDGQAREVLYSPGLFAFGERAAFASALPANLGFAGFRVMSRGGGADWLSFLGATYFRSAGPLDRSGVYARGVAVGTGLPEPESFPRFTGFWLEAVAGRPEALVVHALMEGETVTGAYRMTWERGRQAVTADITAELFVRDDTERLGIAPLNTMFWFGGDGRRPVRDWRRAVHNSQGLAIWTGKGERIWRPLGNPPAVQTNWFVDASPKGFGLMQRKRDFADYEDDRRRFELRPSLWVEPVGDWGEGAVQLVEIPAGDEYTENVVAYWLPKRPATAGSEWTFAYRLHWTVEEPFPSGLGTVVATRIGAGGRRAGKAAPDSYRFVIDFVGGPLARLPADAKVEPALSVSRGTIDATRVVALPEGKGWRAHVDLTAEGADPIDLRLVLHRDGRDLTEIWTLQYPP